MTEKVETEQVEAKQMPPYRQLVYNVIAVALSLFVLAAVNTTIFNEQPNLAIFGMLGLALVFLSQPMLRRWPDDKALQVFDYLLIAGTVVSFGFIFVQSEKMCERFWIDGVILGDRAGNETSLDYTCLLYTSPSPRDKRQSRMPSSA